MGCRLLELRNSGWECRCMIGDNGKPKFQWRLSSVAGNVFRFLSAPFFLGDFFTHHCLTLTPFLFKFSVIFFCDSFVCIECSCLWFLLLVLCLLASLFSIVFFSTLWFFFLYESYFFNEQNSRPKKVEPTREFFEELSFRANF